MTIRHVKKITKQRGHRNAGRGKAKRGRGKGSKMGRGSTKRNQRNKLHILKYQRERLPQKGFRSIFEKQKAINLKDIQLLTDKTEINLADFGYQKVLGSGEMKKALTVTAEQFSESAKAKIEKAGGKAIVSGAPEDAE